jgi:serine/threonine protein kinase
MFLELMDCGSLTEYVGNAKASANLTEEVCAFILL